MMQVLMRFNLRELFEISTANGLRVGIGFPILAWLLVGAVSIFQLRKKQAAALEEARPNLDEEEFGLVKARLVNETILASLFWIAAPVAVVVLGIMKPGLAPDGVPVFGYGFMMFIGFSLAIYSATRRAKLVGLGSDVIMDLGMWLLVPGIIGARLFYVVQYSDRVLGKKEGFNKLIALVNLPDGGLVFYGGLIAGILGFAAFCVLRKISILLMADIVAPSLFIGLGFGRIGCFLYGCCFGDRCSLPWAVQFPEGSMPFKALVERGFLPPDAVSTFALHPSQIYSSISAFVLAGLLAVYFRHRPWNGAVLAVAWIIYPVNRFVLEFIRGDELGQFDTSLTISQLVSVGLFAGGIAYLIFMSTRKRPNPIVRSTKTQPIGAAS